MKTDHLVGRAEELGSFARALAELDQGHSAAILVVGEPGIGKTRLLTEFGARADAAGHLVLSGSASELEHDLPFSVFVDALDEYVRGLAAERLAVLDDDVRTELAHVFPSLTALAGGRQAALQHERYRSHRAVRTLLEQLASTQPLVVELDDLHWADPASIELLGALLRRPPAAPVLLALATRPRHVPERLSAALERAWRAEQITRIELGALSAGETRELLGDVAARVDPHLLYVESGGNPFYLEQLARSLDRASSAWNPPDETSLAGIGVPATVAAALGEELALLSGSERLVLEGAAVAGDPFEPELAAAASGMDEAAVMKAIDELLKVDLLRTTDVPRRFRFRHPLVRRAVYEAAAPGWRLGAHERSAEALAARGASASSRAHHVERSAREGDVDAVAVLREAGEEAVRLAPASAAHWFGEALRLEPASALPEERIELLLARARALTAVGRFNESRSTLLDALAIVPSGADALRARLAHACAGVETNLGLQGQAHERLTRALEELPDHDSREAVALMLDLTVNALWRARHGEMHEAAGRAVAAARRLGDIPMTAAALAELGLADSLRGAGDRAESNRSEAAALVDALSDDELAGHLEAAAWLAGVELYLDRYAEGEMHANRALAVARATGQGELFLLLAATLGGLLRQRGKLAESVELLDAGIEAARLLGNRHALCWTLLGRSAAALRSGDTDIALATAQESVDLSHEAESGFHSAEGAADLASALLETGQPQRAVELLLESAGGEELALIAGSPRARYLEVLVRCWLALDRRAEAERAAAAARTWAAAVQLPMATAWAERASAAVELDGGDPADAARHALAAASAADEAGAPIEGALSRLLAGRALAQAGDRERAAAELRRSAADFRECEALRYRGEAERELRKLGYRIQQRTRPAGPTGTTLESLTERELQLAMLVCDRKTNPEIASELFLSQKTVETHLRNIFRKVGVSSRVELARAVERARSNATGAAEGV
ncbi:MAG TPA: AAA family ATPase [Gaiellaceae bacterium]|nr:AAA family ATPase [Gaiellaceae bacterium]